MKRAAVSIRAARVDFDERNPEIARRGAALNEAIDYAKAVLLNPHTSQLLFPHESGVMHVQCPIVCSGLSTKAFSVSGAIVLLQQAALR